MSITDKFALIITASLLQKNTRIKLTIKLINKNLYNKYKHLVVSHLFSFIRALASNKLLKILFISSKDNTLIYVCMYVCTDVCMYVSRPSVVPN